MTAADYLPVIKKLVKEIPFLYLVDLYMWGEPLLNPDLSKIIEINNSLGISSGISSNFNMAKNLEAVIKAGPAQIRISISGSEPETYEITHSGGKWANVERNIPKLAEYIQKYSPQTLVEVYFHANRQNKNSYKKVFEICSKYGFRIAPSIHMIFPAYVLDYLKNGKKLSGNADKAANLMLVDLDKMIAVAQAEKEKGCLLKRCVPCINWNRSVFACCNMLPYEIFPDYLSVSLEEVIQGRNHAELCKECQKYALHRYFNPLHYADIVQKLYPPGE